MEANTLLRARGRSLGDAGYQGAGKRCDAKDNARRNIAMRPGKLSMNTGAVNPKHGDRAPLRFGCPHRLRLAFFA